MAFGGGGYAVSFPAAAALAGIMDGCLDRYNELYGCDRRVQACLAELGVPLTREAGFHQLDLKGHVYGLLAPHPVAPLVSLHHLDRLSPISPNSLRRLHAVRSLVGASRRDPARTLQQSICYHRSRSRSGGGLTLSVSVSWGYMLQTPLRTFRAWSGSPANPFTVKTRPEAAPNATARPIMFYLDRATPATAQPSTRARRCRRSKCARSIRVDPAVWKRIRPEREGTKEEDSMVVEIYECKPKEAALML
ncbi:hypothetical protein SETIT_9G460500v2 [Setaria italica]|uniref:Uncharacterized protein n=1 Tax=Setaria italica TaxID=4555 RepID=A0A368SSZ5_SETIT|nr:hypothetical protein SETIT_9G460500v2 [Setaria italica]